MGVCRSVVAGELTVQAQAYATKNDVKPVEGAELDWFVDPGFRKNGAPSPYHFHIIYL